MSSDFSGTVDEGGNAAATRFVMGSSCSDSFCSDLNNAANEVAACSAALSQLDDTAGYICATVCNPSDSRLIELRKGNTVEYDCVGRAEFSVILIGPVDEQTVLGSLNLAGIFKGTTKTSGGPTTIAVQFGTADNGATVSPDDVNDVFEGKQAAWGKYGSYGKCVLPIPRLLVCLLLSLFQNVWG